SRPTDAVQIDERVDVTERADRPIERMILDAARRDDPLVALAREGAGGERPDRSVVMDAHGIVEDRLFRGVAELPQDELVAEKAIGHEQIAGEIETDGTVAEREAIGRAQAIALAARF